ncbi:tripartite tricarboxylate transporter substrate-binding protein [Cupriavidus basilensis]|uniref:Tripartite tricarboxylate transporter substrate-binding protein n=1 Tax=Cupriavidus basilensis TaxID=68895 RepID=A0ABT6B324_9BURK|nr:tripartite tricarboxylate transporter substrate-binding protein [Cupriavidus basilensis]MDF3839280.1 tripartite tricarboxylate transporter substrate-binding protein [Cupriavidus basilensis]
MRFVLAALRPACAALALGAACAPAAAAPECIVPAKPGGGFDLTCKLAQRALLEAGLTEQPMRLVHMPGGIGAVAYNSMVAQRPAEPDTIVAFSGGSLLALAEGKFGKYGPADVRWVGALGVDYGMIAVRADSPYRNLKDLVTALGSDPDQVLFGAGGTIGNQDWIKAALLARQAGVGYKRMRFVGFEGGGEAFTALAAGHVQAVSGDASEAALQLGTGGIRILAVLAEQRLPGRLAGVPTAREQGYDITWPIVRGFYMGPKVPQADYQRWASRFERLQASPAFARLRAEQGLFPTALGGAALDAYVKSTVQRYGALAKEFGLVR